MNFLVNYKVIKDEFYFETFLPKVEIVEIDGKIWSEMPVGMINVMTDTKKLFLYTEGRLLGEEEAEIIKQEILAQTKQFRFNLNKEGRLIEDDKGEIFARLPMNINVDDLDYINGEVLLLEKEIIENKEE